MVARAEYLKPLVQRLKDEAHIEKRRRELELRDSKQEEKRQVPEAEERRREAARQFEEQQKREVASSGNGDSSFKDLVWSMSAIAVVIVMFIYSRFLSSLRPWTDRPNQQDWLLIHKSA